MFFITVSPVSTSSRRSPILCDLCIDEISSQLLTVLFAAVVAAAPTSTQDLEARVVNPTKARVTNVAANSASANINDGVGAGVDSYTYYSGRAANFPLKSKWVSFGAMFTKYKTHMRMGCQNNGWGPNDTEKQIQDIYNAIQSVSAASLVDHRYILAIVMQESVGCVWAPTTNNGVRNPGLMQSHNGATFNPSTAATQTSSIRQMIVDGTQGTTSGDGLVQYINRHGGYYAAARGYNSGSIARDGNLSNGNGATPCYVSDVANRLTGWLNAPSKCRN
ncbi:MAG: hypothetical protein M1837_007386 [Sclerophora amabilis]|nr:MAG: hypothetical protein M1837_007386 [Sclerophora amabilis]